MVGGPQIRNAGTIGGNTCNPSDANHALFSIIPGVVGQWLGAIPFLTVGIPAVISLYFDWFGSFMQAFIFCMLTMMFISTAAE